MLVGRKLLFSHNIGRKKVLGWIIEACLYGNCNVFSLFLPLLFSFVCLGWIFLSSPKTWRRTWQPQFTRGMEVLAISCLTGWRSQLSGRWEMREKGGVYFYCNPKKKPVTWTGDQWFFLVLDFCTFCLSCKIHWQWYVPLGESKGVPPTSRIQMSVKTSGLHIKFA